MKGWTVYRLTGNSLKNYGRIRRGGNAMSYADKIFIQMCRDIIDNGTSTEGEKVRPVWEDGTPAYTIKNSGL